MGYKKFILNFKDKKTLYELSLVHFLILFSLLFIAQYSYALFFQFFYLLVIVSFKKKSVNSFVFGLYLFFTHYALVLFFTSNFVTLYFSLLLVVILLLYKQKDIFSNSTILACGISILLLLLGLKIFNIFIYDIYIWLEIVDAPRVISEEVLYLLTLLHIFLFVFIEFKKK
jgi:hypothetical protein